MIGAVLGCLLGCFHAASAQSNFQIQSLQRNSDGSVNITWPVMPNWRYHVYYADTPNGVWQPFPDGQITAGTNALTLCYTDAGATNVTQRFYKVGTAVAQLQMMLVLDTSGSMGCLPLPGGDCSGGGQYMAVAVTNFITQFNDNTDMAGMVDFNTIATLDVSLEQPFKSAIISTVGNLSYSGWTYAAGGLQTALNEFNSVTNPPGQNVLRVVVFFTDGFANTSLKTLDCSTTPVLMSQTDPIGNPTGPWFYSFEDPSNGYPISCDSTSFLSVNGTSLTISTDNQNVWNEGELEALAAANQLRQQNVIIYTVGLGTSTPPIINTTFLEEVANANDSSNLTYDATQPAGAALFVPTPAQLIQAFQQIAAAIHSRNVL